MSERVPARDIQLLIRLTEQLDVTCDRATALRYLEASRREQPAGSEGNGMAFALAARRAGLRVTRLEESIEDAATRATKQTPVVARLPRSGGNAWIVSTAGLVMERVPSAAVRHLPP